MCLFGNLLNFAEAPKDQAGFEDVFEIARTGELQGEELKKYVVSMLDEYSVYTTTEYARKEGYKEGKAEGIAEEREAIAKSLLKLGVSVEIVAQASGLSQEAVHAL